VLIVIGLLIVGVGSAFLLIGLDKADKVASAIGALVGLAGLGVSVWAYPKSASLPRHASGWGDVQVADSKGVQIGNRTKQTNTFEAEKKDTGSTLG
jgi:hypothetical protein